MTLSFFVTLSDSFNLTNIAWIHYVSIISIAMNLDGLIMSCKLAMTKFTKNTLCLRQRRHFVFVDILKSKEGGGLRGKGVLRKNALYSLKELKIISWHHSLGNFGWPRDEGTTNQTVIHLSWFILYYFFFFHPANLPTTVRAKNDCLRLLCLYNFAFISCLHYEWLSFFCSDGLAT